MSERTMLSARTSVTVKATPERAFEVFTAGFGTWWPMAGHHIGAEEAVDVIIEPHQGGRWFERAADGTECTWGFVTAWQPPARVLLAWHLSPDWEFDPDPARATEVEVTFTPEADHTVVTLEHRGFENLGDRAQEVRDAVGDEGGWPELLEMYATAAQAAR